MSLSLTQLIVLDTIGKSIFTVDGEGENQTLLQKNVDKAPDGMVLCMEL